MTLLDTIIVAIFNQKGGCAKTVTTIQLGDSLGRRGEPTLVVDLDKQHTAMTWASMATAEEPFNAKVITLAGMNSNFLDPLQKQVGHYKYILLDCPPAIDSPIPWAALQVADIGLMPIIPDLGNYWASQPAKELGNRAKEINPGLKLFWLLSRVKRGKATEATIKLIRGDEVPTFNAQLSDRNAFYEGQYFGVSALGLDNTNAKAELNAVTDEFLAYVKQAKKGGK